MYPQPNICARPHAMMMHAFCLLLVLLPNARRLFPFLLLQTIFFLLIWLSFNSDPRLSCNDDIKTVCCWSALGGVSSMARAQCMRALDRRANNNKKRWLTAGGRKKFVPSWKTPMRGSKEEKKGESIYFLSFLHGPDQKGRLFVQLHLVDKH